MTAINLDVSIILTLGYSAQFGQGLQKRKLYQRLIATSNNFHPTQEKFSSVLQILVKKGVVIKKNHVYTLCGHNKALDNILTLNQHRNWQEAQKVVNFLEKFPWIQAIAVTGSLAMGKTHSQDDIDFMIVTDQKRLWLVRLLVTFYTLWAGKKKTRGKLNQLGWCFNLWLEKNQLAMPMHKRSLYTAYELTQACWLLATKKVLSGILVKNRWFLTKMPLNHLNLDKVKLIKKQPVSNIQSICYHWLLDVLNFLAFCLQKLYMSGHQTIELVTAGTAFFHPLDTKKRIYTNWKKTLKRWSLSL